MSYEVSQRDLTPQEAAGLRLGRLGAQGCMDTLLGPLLPGGGVAILGYLVFGGIAGLLTKLHLARPPFPNGLLGIFLWLPLILGMAVGWYFQVRIRAAQRRIREDLRVGKVEVLRVKTARVLEAEAPDDDGPLYYFDLGEGRILFLGGPSLISPSMFGLGELEDDDVEPKVPFPSSMFIVHRLPTSGALLRIEALGEPLRPEGYLAPGSDRVGPPGSAMIEGAFEDLVKRARPATERRT